MKNTYSRSSVTVKKTLLCAALLAGLGTSASASADDINLTWNGITLYGTVDIGVGYQNHGTDYSGDMYIGQEYLISKNSNKSVTSITNNAMSQSKVGLKGTEAVADGLDFVFNMEMGFNPASGSISDALGSLTYNNGRLLNDQKTAADGSRAGQVFNGQGWAGLSSKEFAMRLLEEEGVAAVPGSAFGASGEGFLRCCYATGFDELKLAMDKMERFVKRLQPAS